MIEPAVINSFFGVTLALCDPNQHAPRGVSNRGEPFLTRCAASFRQDVGGVGAIGEGVCLGAHGLNMTGAPINENATEL